MDASVVQRVVREVRRDLESGAWDERYGYLRKLDAFDAGLRLVVSDNRLTAPRLENIPACLRTRSGARVAGRLHPSLESPG